MFLFNTPRWTAFGVFVTSIAITTALLPALNATPPGSHINSVVAINASGHAHQSTKEPANTAAKHTPKLHKTTSKKHKTAKHVSVNNPLTKPHPNIEDLNPTGNVSATEKFRVAATTQTVTPASPMPVGNLTGWTQTYAEDFTKTATRGNVGNVYGNRLLGYAGFPDTSKNGMYTPSKVLSTHDSLLDYYIHSANGVALVAAPAPQGYTGQLYGKYTIRFRSDTIPGYKLAFLLWPDSDNWADGELDFPEGELGQTIYGFAHNTTGNPAQNAAALNTGLTMNAWHTLSIEWTPNKLTYIIDGNAQSTTDPNAIPKKAMHLILQAETDLDGTRPSTSAAGHLQIDWLTIYDYTP